MGKQFEALTDAHRAFIEKQKIFFVSTVAKDGRINLSPKGLDSLRVVGPKRILWLNLTGSGNETAAHLALDGRITIMLCAFEGAPLILKAYGKGRAVHRHDPEWEEWSALFPADAGARQVIEVEVELVITSCGFGVPLFSPEGDRTLLTDWSEKKGEDGIRQYWSDRNTETIDGFPTGILDS